MKKPVDLYTKVVLTVIALALSVIAYQLTFAPHPAYADYGQQITDVNIARIGGWGWVAGEPPAFMPPIPVKIK